MQNEFPESVSSAAPHWSGRSAPSTRRTYRIIERTSHRGPSVLRCRSPCWKTFADQAVIAIENVRLFKELQVRNRDLTEALEQQTATSEILRVIASSPTNIQPVLDVVAENAARLCESQDGQIHARRGDMLRKAAGYGQYLDRLCCREAHPISRVRGFLVDRAVRDGQTIHIHDYGTES